MTLTQYQSQLWSVRAILVLLEIRISELRIDVSESTYDTKAIVREIAFQNAQIQELKTYRRMLSEWFWESRIGNPPPGPSGRL